MGTSCYMDEAQSHRDTVSRNCSLMWEIQAPTDTHDIAENSYHRAGPHRDGSQVGDGGAPPQVHNHTDAGRDSITY